MSNSLKFSDGGSVDAEMANMSKAKIISAVPEVSFKRKEKRKRTNMLEAIAGMPPHIQKKIRIAAITDCEEKSVSAVFDYGDRCARVGDEDEMESAEPMGQSMAEERAYKDEDDFLKPCSPDTVERCISEFIDATGNEAVHQHVCMVCARELWMKEVMEMMVTDIPNGQLLTPNEAHPAHQLTSGMLLERQVMKEIGRRLAGDVCYDCLRSLNSAKVPPLSLANNMWVGEIPLPKQRGASRWSSSAFNSGLKGNVSTFKLNTEDITELVNSDIMPLPTKILASTIGVTIIDPKNRPERTLPGFFRVRRECVRRALEWLTEHNDLYKQTAISEPRLKDLPEDGIPDEISDTIRHSNKLDPLEREGAGYVEDDADTMEVETRFAGKSCDSYALYWPKRTFKIGVVATDDMEADYTDKDEGMDFDVPSGEGTLDSDGEFYLYELLFFAIELS